MSANGLEENGGHTNTTNSSSNLIRNKRYVAHVNPMYRNIDFLKRDGKTFFILLNHLKNLCFTIKSPNLIRTKDCH